MLNKILPIIKHPAFIGVVSAVVGAAASHVVTKRIVSAQLEEQYKEFAIKEIVEAQTYYKKLNKVEEYSDPIKARAAMAKERFNESLPTPETVERIQLEDEEIARERSEYLQQISDHVFTNADASVFSDEDKDDGLDRANRSEENPYIISHLEWENVDPDYTRDNLTYYEADDTLATMDDDIVTDPVGLVGIGNLKFGLASGDPDTVFILNHRHRTVMEVTRSEFSFAEVVLGHHPSTETPHIRHERDRRKVPRIRIKDDD